MMQEGSGFLDVRYGDHARLSVTGVPIKHGKMRDCHLGVIGVLGDTGLCAAPSEIPSDARDPYRDKKVSGELMVLNGAFGFSLLYGFLAPLGISENSRQYSFIK